MAIEIKRKLAVIEENCKIFIRFTKSQLKNNESTYTRIVFLWRRANAKTGDQSVDNHSRKATAFI